MIQSFKILPLLIFVAMLAFSVRLSEVVTGINELPGAAQAATKEEKEDKGEEKKAEKEEEHKDDAKKKKAASKKSKKSKKKEDKEPDLSKWRDPKDEDPSYDIIRAELFEEMVERRKGLETKERALQTREALLKAAEQELDRKYQELSQLRKEIESLLETQSGEEQKRVASLVKIYEGMKPKDAARIFDTLDLDVLVAVVSSMSERKLSPVLAAMNPERARTITIMLAEQKKLPTLPP